MSERLVRTGLLLPAVGGWAASLLVTAVPGAAPAVAVVAAAGALSAVLAARRTRTRPRQLLAAGLLITGLVAVAVQLASASRFPDALPVGRPVVVEARVASVAATTGNGPAGGLRGGSVVRATLVAVGEGADRVPLSTPAVLFAEGADHDPGQVMTGVVVLRRAPATDQAAWIGTVRGRLRPLHDASPPERAAQVLRQRFLQVSAFLPGDGGALLPGLATGDTSRVGPDLQQAMRDASLTHLTAVSGANCAVVVLAVLGVAARLRVPRAPRTVLAGAALAGFVVLVTPQPSVVRASVMAAVGLACVLAGRRTAGVPALSVTVLLLLLLDPWIAWSAGFVLSVAATAGLLLLAAPLADRLARRLPPRLALLLAVPIAAQAACQPVLVLLQPGIPVFGVLANLLAEPAVPVVTVLGLIACLTAPVVPALAGGLALLAWLPASWIGLVARAVGALPQVPWAPGLGGAVLAALLVACGLLALRRRSARGVRIAAGAVAVVAALAIAGAALGGVVGRSAGTPRDWTLAACDVGQGDGLVLQAGGRFALVDTGREPGPLLACLDRLGVRRIDLLVLTHWDADHVGAAQAVADRVGTALVGPVDGAPARRLRGSLARAGARVVQVHRGDAASLGPMRLDVLWPPLPLGDVEPGNAASIALHVTGPGPSVLMTGDLGEQAQDTLLAAGPLPRVDVVKVAHHGSADQSPALYAAARAALGVVSVGEDNDYGHPTRRLLRILAVTGTRPVRTDQDGLVLIGRREGRLRLWTEHPVTAAVWTPAK